MKILVIAAHPDDEVLGCGGTIARLVKEGQDVYIAILGEGITSRYKQGEQVNSAVEQLHATSRNVAKMLGAKDFFSYRLPDNRFDTLPLLDVVKIVEDLVARLTPQIIYTHHGGDLNVDHAVVNRAVLTATRPMQGNQVRDIYAFEIPSSTEWSFQRFEPAFRPNFFLDISTTIETKLNALSQYDTEVRTFPHPRSPEAIRSNAARWGSVVGCEAAEAFELIRAIRLGGDANGTAY